jgi:hypothetical protein
MKRICKAALIILPVILFFLPFTAYSDYEITFQWDASDSGVSGYRLYGREAGHFYDYDEFWCQTDSPDTQCTIEELDENTTYYFIVRAFDEDGNESADSNEVVFRYGSPAASDINPSGSGGGSGSAGCFLEALVVE